MTTLTKDALKKHMEARYKMKLAQLECDFKDKIDEVCDPVLDEMIQFRVIENKADKFAEEVGNAVSRFNFTSTNLGLAHTVTYLNKTSNMGISLKNEIKRTINYSVKNPDKKFVADNNEIYELQMKAVAETKSILQSIADLKILKSEIERIIVSQSSAKKAVAVLTELGVDVGEIAPEAMLPAIVKLSVDVNLIN
ncbi:hypothetical protein [Paenibacillus sp. MMO-177]|uniref:hypothetical protein n=1 Tax=Paenibacillus sp. MMO-177 TaxID=3081289 RepID=UPI00301A75D4